MEATAQWLASFTSGSPPTCFAVLAMALARAAGYQPVEMAAVNSLDAMISAVRTQATAALTDLRLIESWDVQYNGAQLAARLFGEGFPAILVSEYANDDADTVIRLYRRQLPEVLRADAVESPAQLRAPLQHCYDELRGNVPIHRRGWRALARVTSLHTIRNEPLIEVLVPEWSPAKVVRLPIALIPPEYRDLLVVGYRFFSRINTDARNSEEIYFDGFEPAPEVGE